MVDNWYKCSDKPMPNDESIFLALWEGNICLAEYDKGNNEYDLMCTPYMQCCVSLRADSFSDITHWTILPDLPVDY